MWHVRSRPCHVVLSEMALASQAALLLYQGLDGHYYTVLYLCAMPDLPDCALRLAFYLETVSVRFNHISCHVD